MIIGQLDLAVRLGAASIFLLLALLLLGHRRQLGLPPLLFAPLAVCVTGFVLGNTPISALQPVGLAKDLAHAASGFTVIFLWWFSLSCFDSRFRLKGGVLIMGLIWAALAICDRGLFGKAIADVELSRWLVPLGFAIVGHLVWRLLGERQGDLIQQRHDARILVAIVLGGMLFIDLAADALFGTAWRPLAFSLAQNVMILMFGLWLSVRLLTVRAGVLSFGVAEPAAVPGMSPPHDAQGADQELRRRLSVLIDTDHVYRDPELTFARFVDLMGAPERSVRMLVNQQLGYDHFRTFLNTHRVREARRLLEERDGEEKLIAIALDSGFASLASFNRAFRAIQGCTPSAYRTAVRQHGPTAHYREQPGSEERKPAF
ncbi:helix-turn-helix domain-containing protein [Sphingomonas changnyeongensis]|uniref:Helix-turn-helix domain-containing protein n=1 Tax=Sphingomonas changnyeongensis TaxID=2698679 RepID=A0A7Z2NU14_9SPHN|nr:helix-turn-helix domain-containing protein [Sphingomonas changnyeongensis]QHL89843.1 helix-turn-helix domain-containing protein [Sphingomonas changnyeongensis]